MNSKQKGDIAETRAIYEFVKRGIPVCIPYGDNLRYDLIAEFNGKLNKIQVKMCNEERTPGAVICYTRSSTNHTTNKKLSDYSNDIDYFVIFNQIHDLISIIPIEVVGKKKSMVLRLEEKIKNPSSNYFSDYSFDNLYV